MKWCECLDDNLAFDVPTACPSCNLREQLKCAFAGAEVGLMQSHVRINNSNQCHIGEMQALGNNLCSKKHIDFTRAKISQDATVIILALEGVGVHPHNPRVRKQLS